MAIDAQTAVTVVAVLGTVYFGLWTLSQLTIAGVAAVALWRHSRRYTQRARALVDHVSLPRVSIIVPAFNEELTIVESIRALLALDYEQREIVVVNDGSSDDTLALLQRTFQLLPAPLAFVQPLPSALVRGIYRSVSSPGLVVLDKVNGGCKADATNAGINAASGMLVLVIDADTVLDIDAMNQAVLSFLEDPTTIAVGGYVAIANGCRIERGRVSAVELPRSWLARFQIAEYMRAFLMFRMACASANALSILSGAFGLFRRDAVIAVGGYDRSAIGEDMDLTMRLHGYFSARRTPFRIAFTPFPLCRTQAPEDWASLRSQRFRWRRGLLQAIWRHRRLIGNPRCGVTGLAVLPYTISFEVIGPLLEFATYITIGIVAVFGLFDWHSYWLMILIWILLGTTISLIAILFSDRATRDYLRTRDLPLLFMVAVLENVGYRQLNSWWACVGTVQALAGTGGWGTMKRRTFQEQK